MDYGHVRGPDTPPATIYLHGLPGAPGELALIGLPSWYAPDRIAIVPGGDAEAMLDALSADLTAQFGQRKLHLIGFSLGAFVAIALTVRIGDRVTRLDLVSGAAPLESGNYISTMAGGSIFDMARAHPRRFQLLVAIQAIAVAFVPSLLHRMMFGTATGRERALAATPAVRRVLIDALKSTFRNGGAGYAREIKAYVAPWQSLLGRVHCPTVIWHGTDDRWAPFAMASALQSASGMDHSRLEPLDGHGHYSTLAEAARRIAEEIS
jgi:pimeloyl-ACP methyl ester carboxylesterase